MASKRCMLCEEPATHSALVENRYGYKEQQYLCIRHAEEAGIPVDFYLVMKGIADELKIPIEGVQFVRKTIGELIAQKRSADAALSCSEAWNCTSSEELHQAVERRARERYADQSGVRLGAWQVDQIDVIRTIVAAMEGLGWLPDRESKHADQAFDRFLN